MVGIECKNFTYNEVYIYCGIFNVTQIKQKSVFQVTDIDFSFLLNYTFLL